MTEFAWFVFGAGIGAYLTIVKVKYDLIREAKEMNGGVIPSWIKK